MRNWVAPAANCGGFGPGCTGSTHGWTLASALNSAGVIQSAICPLPPPPNVDVIDRALALISFFSNLISVLVGSRSEGSFVSSGYGNVVVEGVSMVLAYELL